MADNNQLEELRRQRQAELEAEMKMGEVARQLLDDSARQRLNNVKLVNRELYLRAIQTIVYLKQSSQLPGKLDEERFKQLLEKLSAKRDITIKRK